VLRALLAVALAVAVLSVSVPAIDQARTATASDRAAAAAEGAVRAFHAVATDEDATRGSLPGARRFFTVGLPERSWTVARVEWFAVGGVPDGVDPAWARARGNGTVVAYRVAGGRPRRHRVSLPGVGVRTPAGPVVFRSAGRHRVVLSLVRSAEGPTVVVEPG
jgi:hypothetical protein